MTDRIEIHIERQLYILCGMITITNVRRTIIKLNYEIALDEIRFMKFWDISNSVLL